MPSHRTNRSVSSLLIACALTACGASPLLASGPDVAGTLNAEQVQRTLLRAAELLERHRPVAARRVLADLLHDGGLGLGQRERTHAYDLMVAARNAERALPAVERDLQDAEAALASDDLLQSERLALSVIDGEDVDGEQLRRAERVLREVKLRRVELEPRVAPALRAAREALERGDMLAAQRSLRWIARSGVYTSPRQRAMLDDLRLQVVALERAGLGGGSTLTLSASAQSDEPPPAPDPIEEANREEVQRLLGQAKTLRENRQYNEALTILRQIEADYGGSLDDETKQALSREIDEILILLQEQPAGSTLGDQVSEREQVRDEVRAVYENLMNRARQALDEGDTTGARDLALQAKRAIEDARDVFGVAEVEQKVSAAEALLTQIDQREEQIRIQELNRQAAEEAERARREAMEREQDKQRKIREAIVRVRELQLERKYREALDVLDQQVLFLDPNNPMGLLLREVIADAAIFQDFNRNRAIARRNTANLTQENRRATIPPAGIVTYPEDWPQLSYLRTTGGQYAESPENRAVLATLREKRLPNVDFANNTLGEVLGFIEQVSLVNMDVDWDALEEINITRDEPVNLSLRNVAIETVLNRVLEKVSEDDFGDKAAWAVQDGVLVISSDEQIRRNTVLDIYDVRDLVVEVPDYTNAPTFDLNSILQNTGRGGGGGGRSPFQNTQQQQNAFQLTPLEERLDMMKDIIRETVDPDGWRANGGDTGFIQDWQGQLIITNTPSNHREIRGLLSKLREFRAVQINVEARFLTVSQDFLEQIGFDIDLILNADNNQITTARGFDPTVLPSDFFQDGRLTRNITGAFQPGGPANSQITQGTVPPNRGFSPVGTIQDSLGLVGALIPSQGIASQVLGRAPALGISGTFLDDVQVDFLLEATQADRRSTTLTAPRLTFTNGQTSNIFITRQVGFVSDLQPIVSDSAVGFDPTINTISEGAILVVGGTASADRRFVTMNVQASIGQIEGFENETITAVAGGQLVQSADVGSNIQVPTVLATQVSTTVTVPDQGTILLGGQRIVSEFEVEAGVPVLSKVPVLNRFFSNRIQTKEEQTLLILLKPTVLIQSEQEELQFPGLGDTLGSSFGG